MKFDSSRLSVNSTCEFDLAPAIIQVFRAPFDIPRLTRGDVMPGPSDSPLTSDPSEIAQAICSRHANDPGALIEILHDVQDKLGFLPQTVLPAIAHALNLSRAEVFGVASFYHEFRREPAGRHVLKLCRAEACQSMGAEDLAGAVSKSLGVKLGETSADGAVTLEAVYCLGNCALSPAAMLDGELIGRASARKIAGLLAGGTSDGNGSA
jgi:formate dehydrogenase subunit gamma